MGLFDRLPLSPLAPLIGDGIALRLPKRKDYRAWARLRARSRDFLQPWEPEWARDELSWLAYRERIRRYATEAGRRESFSFFLFDEEMTTLYGGLTLGYLRRGVAQAGTLGYWLGEPYAGQGLMERGLDRIKRFAFEDQALHRLEAASLPRNARSIGLLEKSGFSREGHLRGYLKIAGQWEDHVLYSCLAEEWSRSRLTTDRPSLAAE